MFSYFMSFYQKCLYDHISSRLHQSFKKPGLDAFSRQWNADYCDGRLALLDKKRRESELRHKLQLSTSFLPCSLCLFLKFASRAHLQTLLHPSNSRKDELTFCGWKPKVYKPGVELSSVISFQCTVIVARMSHKKWRETKQQMIWWPDLALLGCCLVSLQFQCDILATITVHRAVLSFHAM